MPTFYLVDTFPAFLSWHQKARLLEVDKQVNSWADDYMAEWPELLEKQIKEYVLEKCDWRRIARDKVFPFLQTRLPAMQEAHDNIVKACGSIYIRAQEIFNFKSSINFVIYTGIGCGAGWATEYQGTPSVLFGLENIAESGWSSFDDIRGLAAHELGHLIHQSWRKQENKTYGSGPWWRLYEEGFAQRVESLLIDDKPPFYRKGADWYDWCKVNKQQLTRRFMKTVEDNESVSSFFGSWYEISGKSETGYYLGYEVIKELQKQFSLKDIAFFDDVRVYLQPIIGELLQ